MIAVPRSSARRGSRARTDGSPFRQRRSQRRGGSDSQRASTHERLDWKNFQYFHSSLCAHSNMTIRARNRNCLLVTALCAGAHRGAEGKKSIREFREAVKRLITRVPLE